MYILVLTCEAEIGNGYLNITKPATTGTEAKIICNDGYQLNTSNYTAECVLNGNRTEWNITTDSVCIPGRSLWLLLCRCIIYIYGQITAK